MGTQLPLDLRESPLKPFCKPFCDYCGKKLVPNRVSRDGGQDVAGETLCFACCGWADVIDMMNTEPGQRGVTPLWVTSDSKGEPQNVSNWPGSLVLRIVGSTFWHKGGFRSKRRTVYFRGPLHSDWSGVEYNGNAESMLRNVRRLKHG